MLAAGWFNNTGYGISICILTCYIRSYRYAWDMLFGNPLVAVFPVKTGHGTPEKCNMGKWGILFSSVNVKTSISKTGSPRSILDQMNKTRF